MTPSRVSDRDKTQEVEKHLCPFRCTKGGSPWGPGGLSAEALGPGHPRRPHPPTGAGQRPLFPRKRRRGADASRPAARSLRGCSARRRHTGSTPSACRAGRRGSYGRGGAAGPVPLPPPSPLPPGARESRAGPASLPGSCGRRGVSGGFPPRPPAALGDASPITARGEPPLRAPLIAGPASPAPLPA